MNNKKWANVIIAFLIAINITVVHAAEPHKTQYDPGQYFPWQEEVFSDIKTKYGKAASKRIRKIHDLVIQHYNSSVDEKLKLVNDFMNDLPWLTDSDKWKRDDYWATPMETLATYGGDCEDIAIAKYVALRALNIPDNNLAFAHVQLSDGADHMVLLYWPNEKSQPLVLDNVKLHILPSGNRHDLKAIYAFRTDGTVWLITEHGGKRSIKAKIKNSRLKKWTTVWARMKENRKYLMKLNGGRKLFSGH